MVTFSVKVGTGYRLVYRLGFMVYSHPCQRKEEKRSDFVVMQFNESNSIKDLTDSCKIIAYSPVRFHMWEPLRLKAATALLLGYYWYMHPLHVYL